MLFFIVAADDEADPGSTPLPSLPFHLPCPRRRPRPAPHPRPAPRLLQRTMTTTTSTKRNRGRRRAWSRARRRAVVCRSRTRCSGCSVTTATPGITWTAFRATATVQRSCSTPAPNSTVAAAAEQTEVAPPTCIFKQSSLCCLTASATYF